MNNLLLWKLNHDRANLAWLSLRTDQDHYWYAAQVWDHARAADALEDKQIEYIHPVGHFLGGQEYLITPGYLFVLLPCRVDAWADIKATPGIVRLLPAGSETPGVIPHRYMDDFIARLNYGDYDEKVVEVEMPRFHRGESLGIVSGPFVNHTGIFKRVQRGIIVCDVAFLGQTLEAGFMAHQVVKVN